MVRLLQANEINALQVLQKFQSHNGAIAAQFGRFVALSEGKFQSHNGAIAAFQNQKLLV